MKTLETWSGSRVPLDKMPLVLIGWRSYAKRLERQLTRIRNPKLKPQSLEFQLCEILSRYCGERFGDGPGFARPSHEDVIDTLCRIIYERDRALMVLALDRIK